MPLGFKHFTEPPTISERAELKAEKEAWRTMDARIDELEHRLKSWLLSCEALEWLDDDSPLVVQTKILLDQK